MSTTKCTIPGPLWNVLNSDDEVFNREAFACGVYKDRFVIISGGYRGEEELESTVMYDVTTEAYTNLPDLTFMLSCHGVLVKEYFYVCDQRNICRLCLSRPLKWEIVRDIMEYNIGNLMTDGIHIFFIEANYPLRIKAQLYRYDPKADELVNLSIVPVQFKFAVCSSVMVGKTIYLVRDGYMEINVFDVVTQSWTQALSIPECLEYKSTCNIDRWIIVWGTSMNEI